MPQNSDVLGPTAHVDTFARDNLPPADQWPELLLDGFDYPERLNAAVELTDAQVARGHGDRIALIGNGRMRTYKELADWSNRIAHALVEDYGVCPGNRVLIRGPNNPAMVACWLAATKAGAVAVNTMPMAIFFGVEISRPERLNQSHTSTNSGVRAMTRNGLIELLMDASF